MCDINFTARKAYLLRVNNLTVYRWVNTQVFSDTL